MVNFEYEYSHLIFILTTFINTILVFNYMKQRGLHFLILFILTHLKKQKKLKVANRNNGKFSRVISTFKYDNEIKKTLPDRFQ